MDGDSLRSTAVEILAVITTIAATIATLRGKKNVSDTDAKLEAAKQSSVAVYIDQLEAVTKALAQEREGRIADGEASRAREKDLRDQNEAVRGLFDDAIARFRATQAQSDREVADLHENNSVLGGENKVLKAEIERLLNNLSENDRAHETEQHALRFAIVRLDAKNRALINEKFGAGHATDIMGPADHEP